jgi:TRAP-type mannitol/chloroaromatic compound transport system permease small subunit
MLKILDLIDSFNEKFGKAVSYIVWLGAAVLFIEVILRYFFNSPTVWAHGYAQRIFGSYFVLIGAFTLVNNGHVRIDIIVNRFPFRMRKFMDMVNMGMLLVWCGALSYEGWDFFMYSYNIREVDQMVLAHPIYPIKFLLFLGVSLMALQGLSNICRDFLELLNGAPLPKESAKDKPEPA